MNDVVIRENPRFVNICTPKECFFLVTLIIKIRANIFSFIIVKMTTREREHHWFYDKILPFLIKTCGIGLFVLLFSFPAASATALGGPPRPKQFIPPNQGIRRRYVDDSVIKTNRIVNDKIKKRQLTSIAHGSLSDWVSFIADGTTVGQGAAQLWIFRKANSAQIQLPVHVKDNYRAIEKMYLEQYYREHFKELILPEINITKEGVNLRVLDWVTCNIEYSEGKTPLLQPLPSSIHADFDKLIEYHQNNENQTTLDPKIIRRFSRAAVFGIASLNSNSISTLRRSAKILTKSIDKQQNKIGHIAHNLMDDYEMQEQIREGFSLPVSESERNAC